LSDHDGDPQADAVKASDPGPKPVSLSLGACAFSAIGPIEELMHLPGTPENMGCIEKTIGNTLLK
jgi:hypothetical protein